MKKRFLYILFGLFIPMMGIGQFSHIDTAIVKLATIPTSRVGGFVFHNDSLWYLLKSYNKIPSKTKAEVNEFYHIRHKFKEWNLYVMDTSDFELKRKATEYYLPWASPYGFAFYDSLVYYVARKNSFLDKRARLSKASVGERRFRMKNQIIENRSYPWLSPDRKLMYCSKGSMNEDYSGGENLSLFINSLNNWNEVPANLDFINTMADEIAPYWSADSIFYFASNKNRRNDFDLYQYNYRKPNVIEPMSGKINTRADERWFCSETDTSGFFIRQEGRKAVLYKFYCWRVADTVKEARDGARKMAVKTDKLVHSSLMTVQEKKPVEEEERDLTKLFQLNMYELTPMMRDSLIMMAQFLRSELDKHLLIIGHASPDGPEYINMNLSINRANSALDYLIEEENIERDRISLLYGGEYLFTDTIKARRFSMYTLNGKVVPPLMSVYVLKENENADNYLKNFNIDNGDLESIRFELKDIVPLTPDRLYFPVKGMTVTAKTENAGNIAKKFGVTVECILKANRLSTATIDRNTILYIPLESAK